MGMWNITITGTGAHHNKDYPKDAEKMADAFVESLRDAGHTVEYASFTYGCRQELAPVEYAEAQASDAKDQR